MHSAVLFSLTLVVSIGSTQEFIFEQGANGFGGFVDTSIFSEAENSGGGTDGIFTGTTKLLRHRRALLRVDLSSIPAGALIHEVSLTMVVDRSGENFGAFDLNLHRVTRGWGPGTAAGADAGGFGKPASPGDATWDMARFGAEAWTTPGGDFLATPRATASAARSGSVVIWSSAAMGQDVQDWIDFPQDNHGWIIVSAIEGEKQRVKKLFSSEAPSPRPVLRVLAELPDSEMPWGGHTAIAFLIIALGSSGLALNSSKSLWHRRALAKTRTRRER